MLYAPILHIYYLTLKHHIFGSKHSRCSCSKYSRKTWYAPDCCYFIQACFDFLFQKQHIQCFYHTNKTRLSSATSNMVHYRNIQPRTKTRTSMLHRFCFFYCLCLYQRLNLNCTQVDRRKNSAAYLM